MKQLRGEQQKYRSGILINVAKKVLNEKKKLNFFLKIKKGHYICTRIIAIAKIAQLVEHNLAKVGVASSNLVFRSFQASEEFSEAFFMPCYLLLEHTKNQKLACKLIKKCSV